MKKRFLNPMLSLAIVAILGYGCAGSDTTASNTGTTSDPDMTTGTAGTTDTDYGTDDTGTTGTTGTTGNTGMDNSGLETDRVANRDVSVEDMFEDIDNTEQYDIMTLARRYDNLSTFVQLVEAAGIEESFANTGGNNLTFFIPTNEAFAQLPKERYDELTNPANRAELMRVLNLHIYRTELGSSMFTGRQVLDLGEGNQVTVDTGTAGAGVAGAGVASINIGGANVLRSDIRASNGIIHIVDDVIATDADLGTIDNR